MLTNFHAIRKRLTVAWVYNQCKSAAFISIGGLVVKLAVAIRRRPAPGSIPGRCTELLLLLFVRDIEGKTMDQRADLKTGTTDWVGRSRGDLC